MGPVRRSYKSMDEGIFLPIESIIGDISLKPLDVVHSARLGHNFIVNVEVINVGSNTLAWDPEHPINISYRWLDGATGATLVQDGRRAVFSDMLPPQSTQNIQLLVTPPLFCGAAILRISGVCEGRFWFCEQFATGWADLNINIVDPYLWPTELKGSVASRALRGSVAASALRKSLTVAPIDCLAQSPLEKAVPEPVVLSAGEKAQDGFKFSAASVESLSVGPLDACAPASWQSPVSAVTVAEMGGWQFWLRHPFAALGRYLSNALFRSSLGQWFEASQRATEELFERLRQSAENDLHTQFMLRQMASYSERRDLFYAEHQHAHVDFLQQELRSLFDEKIQALTKIVTDGVQANEAARLDVLKQQQTLHCMLQSIIDTSRRLQLGQLKSDEDLKHMQDWQAGMTAKVEAARQHQLSVLSELRETVLLSANNTSKELQARLDDQKTAFDQAIAKLLPFKEDVLASIHEAARQHQLSVLSELRETVLLSANDTSKGLQARLDDQKTAFDQAIAELLPFKEDVLASIHDAQRAMDKKVRAALGDLETGQIRHAEDLEHLIGDFAGVRDILQTNIPYMFAKVDALLHRQVFPATSSGKIICRNAKGLFAVPERDMDALAYFTAGQLPEAGSLAVVERLLQPGDTFVDVGANVGLFSIVAGRRVGSRGKVLSFEPAPETMSALTATVRLNGLGSIVSLHQSAAGRKAGTAKLYVGQTCGHSSLLPLDESKETIEVPMVALDEVIGDQKIDLIKIDVEGWELEALQGLRKTLANNPQASVLLEFGPSHLQRAGVEISTWISTLQALGMTLFEIDEDSASLSPLRSQGLEDIVSINLLLSRNPETHLNQG